MDDKLASQLSHIEARCARIVRALDANGYDELSLLRAGRELKFVHARLRQSLALYARERGWSETATRADFALAELREDLRTALVQYPTLSSQDLRACLTHGLDQALTALDLLEA